MVSADGYGPMLLSHAEAGGKCQGFVMLLTKDVDLPMSRFQHAYGFLVA